MKLLQVGDIIYKESYNKLVARLHIDRVTNNYAFVEKTKFKREYDETQNYFYEIPHDRWYNTSYRIETPEIKIEWNITIMFHTIENFKDWKNLSIDQLKKVYDIIKSEKAIKKVE